MRHAKQISVVLMLVMLAQACGGNFASQLRSILDKSEPLVDALVTAGAIPAAARETYIRDFQDLARGAATMKDELDACKSSNSDPKGCSLDAVDRYQELAFSVFNRGNFGRVEKLQRIQAIVAGIILAARVAFGAVAPRGERIVPIDEGIELLKAEMKVGK